MVQTQTAERERADAKKFAASGRPGTMREGHVGLRAGGMEGLSRDGLPNATLLQDRRQILFCTEREVFCDPVWAVFKVDDLRPFPGCLGIAVVRFVFHDEAW